MNHDTLKISFKDLIVWTKHSSQLDKELLKTGQHIYKNMNKYQQKLLDRKYKGNITFQNFKEEQDDSSVETISNQEEDINFIDTSEIKEMITLIKNDTRFDGILLKNIS